jgi:branched-chain amino acid transport system ATP-binding protein
VSLSTSMAATLLRFHRGGPADRTPGAATGATRTVQHDGLIVRDLSAGYTLAPVLGGTSLDVAPREFCALLGTNGSGKTTLMRAIFGQLAVRGGEVWWKGRRIDRTNTWDRVTLGIAHVPQTRELFAGMTVDENLRLGATVTRSRADVVRRQRELCFELFPRLAERRRQAAGSMSGGEQQMVALARGLMADPQLMLLDEVSSGLSPRMTQEVATALGRINALGVAILAIEHRPWLLEDNAHRVFFLDRGSVAWTGSIHEALDEGRVRNLYLGGRAEEAQMSENRP